VNLQKYYDLSQSPDVGAFESRLVEFAHELDFGIVVATLVIESPGPAHKVDCMAVGNTPDAFTESFKDQPSSQRDPVLNRLKKLSVPFVYDQDTYVSEGAADLWEQQAPYGYRTGIAVALHLPQHRHFLLGVDRDQPLPRHTDRLTRMMADLQLMAVHAQEAASRLLVPEPDVGAACDDPRLTPREVEILRWTMQGKSAWAVGEILSISEHTVNFHLRNVFRKLDASSKHQAVLKAMALGIL
jgi:DNA-binding CsgD family transcriptional regulator